MAFVGYACQEFCSKSFEILEKTYVPADVALLFSET